MPSPRITAHVIQSIIQDETWLDRFEALPVWTMPAGPAVVVSPHPDDETLGTGGLIFTLRQHGVKVTVIAVTDGEGAYEDSPGLAATRRQEQAAALRRLGVAEGSLKRCGLPDRRLAEHEPEIAAAIAAFADAGSHVYAPWQGDFHPDHEGVRTRGATGRGRAWAGADFLLFLDVAPGRSSDGCGPAAAALLV